jgi:hypothetical protein
MTLTEFKLKYGTEGVNLLINHLMIRVELSPYALRTYEELKRDIYSLLEGK